MTGCLVMQKRMTPHAIPVQYTIHAWRLVSTALLDAQAARQAGSRCYAGLAVRVPIPNSHNRAAQTRTGAHWHCLGCCMQMWSDDSLDAVHLASSLLTRRHPWFLAGCQPAAIANNLANIFHVQPLSRQTFRATLLGDSKVEDWLTGWSEMWY